MGAAGLQYSMGGGQPPVGAQLDRDIDTRDLEAISRSTRVAVSVLAGFAASIGAAAVGGAAIYHGVPWLCGPNDLHGVCHVMLGAEVVVGTLFATLITGPLAAIATDSYLR